MAEAGGREKVARAGLEAQRKPSRQATHDLRVAEANSAYAVARERCDDSAGNVMDVCIKEAKDAASAKRAADYAVAKEKCDTFAGEAKSSCMNEAKARFGKS